MPSINIARERSLYRATADRTIQLNRHLIERLQEQLTTGKRINRPSDDPSGFGVSQQLTRLDDRYSQFLKTIEAGRTWTDNTQQALDNLADLFSEAHELAIRFLNDTNDDANDVIGVQQLQDLLDSIVDQLNVKVGDEYLFSGTRTSTKPFEESAGAITYHGNGTARTHEIAPESNLETGITGGDVSDTGEGFTITESLANFLTALQSGDHDAMVAAMDQVVTARDHVINMGALAGTKARRLALAEEQIRDAQLVVVQHRSRVDETDMTAVLVEMQQAQARLQASLHVSSSILQLSILDYL